MYLSDDLIMAFYWYMYTMEPVTVVLLVETAINILNCARRYRLSG